MFLHLSVSHSIHGGGGGLGVSASGYGGVYSLDTHPLAIEAGGTHPTGMHSCLKVIFCSNYGRG